MNATPCSFFYLVALISTAYNLRVFAGESKSFPTFKSHLVIDGIVLYIVFA